jgi:hypothetical protein
LRVRLQRRFFGTLRFFVEHIGGKREVHVWVKRTQPLVWVRIFVKSENLSLDFSALFMFHVA